MPDPTPLVTLPRIEAQAEVVDLLALIARHRALEARLWAAYHRHYARGAAVCAEIAKLPPAPRPVQPWNDPHYWRREAAGQHLHRGNRAWERARAVERKRRKLEAQLGVLEARAGVESYADPFAERRAA